MKTYTYTLFAALMAIVLVGAGCFSGSAEVETEVEVESPVVVDEEVEEAGFVDGIYTLEAEQSAITWKAAHIIGDERTGTIEPAEGAVTIEGGELVDAEFSVAMDTIVAELGDQLTNHLKAEDFFNVEAYPEAVFSLTSVEEIREDEYLVTGDFTIKDITESQEFELALMQTDDNTLWATSTITFDRTRWDVRFGSTKFFSLEDLGEVAVKDDFDLMLDLIFTAE